MLYGMNSATALVGVVFGTTIKRSKSKRLPACTILASCRTLSFRRGGCSRDRERMMMYDSRMRFRMDDTSVVGRNLRPKSQRCKRT
jgi:hypothetical protein